jgi:hypothetical protein
MGCLYSPSRPEEFFSETICSLTNPYALRRTMDRGTSQ